MGFVCSEFTTAKKFQRVKEDDGSVYNHCIKVIKADDSIGFMPMVMDNMDYKYLTEQVKAGTLTIADAD
tara:strand:- start:65 stop:271 length:207 start_codon:yes stop_codon:yes gene_type:complete